MEEVRDCLIALRAELDVKEAILETYKKRCKEAIKSAPAAQGKTESCSSSGICTSGTKEDSLLASGSTMRSTAGDVSRLWWDVIRERACGAHPAFWFVERGGKFVCEFVY